MKTKFKENDRVELTQNLTVEDLKLTILKEVTGKYIQPSPGNPDTEEVEFETAQLLMHPKPGEPIVTIIEIPNSFLRKIP